MPSTGVKSAVSDYEHLNSKYPSRFKIDRGTVDANEDDDFLPLQPPAHTSGKQFLPLNPRSSDIDINKCNLQTGIHVKEKIGLTELLDDFDQIRTFTTVPVPVAWSPGMRSKANPTLFITPEKIVHHDQGKDKSLQPQDVSKIPQPVAWSPGMKIQPNPLLFVTPDKLSDVKSSSTNYCNRNIFNCNETGCAESQDTFGKTKHSVRFDLPSASSGEDTLDLSGKFNSNADSLTDSDLLHYTNPVRKSLSLQKAYDPNVYSEESTLDESILTTLPALKSKGSSSTINSPYVTLSTADELAEKLNELLLSSKPSSETWNLKSTSQSTDIPELPLPNQNYPETRIFKPAEAMTGKNAKSQAIRHSSKLKDPSTVTSGVHKCEGKTLADKAGPQFLKSPLSPYEPPPAGPYVIRESKNNLVSTEYSFPFNAGAVYGESEYEHAFARPEFNSTLKVRRELDNLCEQEVDVRAAVAESLAKSESKRSELNEKAALYTNRMSNQFKNLVDLDTSVEKLCDRVVRMRTSRAPAKKKAPRAEKKKTSNQTAPDLMEFFTSDIQKETPNLALPGMTTVTSQLTTSPHDLAFDLYRHNRVWHGIRDFL